ncbi:MAG: MBL fold metallo-hydrolase [Deltaproteobacteria bacterium]|nr:MBL fold metallo-hydrolase [Deltaproteobacteria bacterium]
MSKIRNIQVTEGLYWVEVPEIELYVQCGSPADSVKNLMKKGLITSAIKDGISIETGPNAILLADVSLQNGHVTNLAEFPVLQMLYRQGMILPGHPNNTGLKPLLIGSEEQIQSQMQYIYRGNYGLISEEEITGTGVSAKDAQEIMRIKLKFAFGQIRSTEELLDYKIIGKKPVEIRNGLFVRRLRLNLFEFQYGEESVTVDLNLGPNESYSAPYPLGFHDFKREYFAVIHSGEGDGWDINRPCMSSILMYQGKIYLIDAGPNIIFSLKALGIGINEIEGIFHTHAHDDHFAGLTSLLRSGHKLKYYTSPLVRASVSKKLKALTGIEEENFSDFFEVHDLTLGTWNDVGGLEVKPILSPHPLETNILIFRALFKDGYQSYAHFADLTSFEVL